MRLTICFQIETLLGDYCCEQAMNPDPMGIRPKRSIRHVFRLRISATKCSAFFGRCFLPNSRMFQGVMISV
jgi:hypothetical protein